MKGVLTGEFDKELDGELLQTIKPDEVSHIKIRNESYDYIGYVKDEIKEFISEHKFTEPFFRQIPVVRE